MVPLKDLTVLIMSLEYDKILLTNPAYAILKRQPTYDY